MKITVNRFLKTEEYTAGYFDLKGRRYYTLERPWKNNAPNISCIPHGIYEVEPHGWEKDTTVKHKRTYHVKNVLGRSAILIHIGNWVKQIEGCLLVGTGFSVNEHEAKVQSSRMAMDDLRQIIGENNFKLEIKG